MESSIAELSRGSKPASFFQHVEATVCLQRGRTCAPNEELPTQRRVWVQELRRTAAFHGVARVPDSKLYTMVGQFSKRSLH